MEVRRMKTTAKSFLFCCVTLCMTIAMLTVGCTNGKQYFEKGTEVGFQKRYGEYTIVCEFDENSLGEEYAKKYRNFCKEEGIAAKEELRDATVYGALRMIIGGQASSYTLKSVAEVPSTTQVVYFNGRKRLGKGEILVHSIIRCLQKRTAFLSMTIWRRRFWIATTFYRNISPCSNVASWSPI